MSAFDVEMSAFDGPLVVGNPDWVDQSVGTKRKAKKSRAERWSIDCECLLAIFCPGFFCLLCTDRIETEETETD
jgi:hypothetical protein